MRAVASVNLIFSLPVQGVELLGFIISGVAGDMISFTRVAIT